LKRWWTYESTGIAENLLGSCDWFCNRREILTFQDVFTLLQTETVAELPGLSSPCTMQ